MEHPISMRSYILPAIQKEIYDLFSKQKWCDANVKGFTRRGEKSNLGVECHQLVLAMASPVIKHALQKATDGSKQMCCCEQQTAVKDGCFVFDGRIILAGASDEVVRSLIPFIYGKSISENAELKNEITEWLNALQITKYRHDRNLDSDDELLDDNHPLDETTKNCNGIDSAKNQCIACKKIFNSSQTDLYVKHLSAHKTAMLEQLKESKKNADGSKEFFCDMCQSMVRGSNFGAHIRQCFITIKAELDKFSGSQVSNNNSCDKEDTSNKATSAPSHPFTCSSCKKSFRYKLALKKHACSKNRNEPQKDHEMDSTTSASSHSTLNTAMQMKTSHKTSTWDSSSEDEVFSRTSIDSNNDQKPNGVFRHNHHNKMKHSPMRPIAKSKGRPCGNTRIPRHLIYRKSFGSGDCPVCGESYPNKEILKLHTCKSYLGLETENEYRTDRQNVELFARTTQRRSLEESPPMSPVPKAKKKRTYRSRNRRSRSRSSPTNRSESRNSSKSQNLDTESSLTNPVSSTDEDEVKEPSFLERAKAFSKLNRDTNAPRSTSGHPLKTRILSSIFQSETQFPESSETDDNGSIINRAINSLDKEMATSQTSGLINYTSRSIPNSIDMRDNSQNATNTSLKSNSTSRFESNVDSHPSPSSPNKITNNNPEVAQSELSIGHSSSSQLQEKQSETNFLSCEQCGEPFSDQTKLTNHILEEHDSDPFD